MCANPTLLLNIKKVFFFLDYSEKVKQRSHGKLQCYFSTHRKKEGKKKRVFLPPIKFVQKEIFSQFKLH